MRDRELSEPAKDFFRNLAPKECRAVAAVIAELQDEHVPLVRPADFSVTHGSNIMGRAVPGTDLVVAYVPGGSTVFVVRIYRRPGY